ncbi:MULTISPECIES: hypothetical protein [unclassified Microcoleus]|uniref:hypothetical protein n=1 Tax=unclassified Microcoleus TaxID=2642155 RepID=UPI002FD5D1DA
MPLFRNPGRTGGHHLGFLARLLLVSPPKQYKTGFLGVGVRSPTVSAEIPSQKQKFIKCCGNLYKECLKQPQNQVAAAKLRNLQWALTHCQSIFGQVVIAISRGIK